MLMRTKKWWSLHQKVNVQADIVKKFTSPKRPLFVKEVVGKNSEQVAPESRTKPGVFECALQSTHCFPSVETCFTSYAPVPTEMRCNWAKYPGNNPYSLSCECMKKLKELYDIGIESKNKKFSPERAQQVLLETDFIDRWDEKFDITIPKIKAFFSMKPSKMIETLQTNTIEAEAVEAAAAEIADAERENKAATLMDVEDIEDMHVEELS